jgi:squalene-associated FAD-dependent desaturase
MVAGPEYTSMPASDRGSKRSGSRYALAAGDPSIQTRGVQLWLRKVTMLSAPRLGHGAVCSRWSSALMAYGAAPFNAAGPRVAIVGGGLAGLAAALRLAEQGCNVELFELRRQLGGRAASFRDPTSDELVDYCQHVSMGCCTNLADFCQRTGINGQFERYSSLNVIAPDANRYRLNASSMLPAPLHLLPAMLRLGYLPLADRVQTVRLLLKLARSTPGDSVTTLEWLQSQNVGTTALKGFWDVILVSALGETVDRVALTAARKVLVDGFMSHRRAYEVLVPTCPLSELIDQQVGRSLEKIGVVIRRETAVESVTAAAGDQFDLRTSSGPITCDAVIIATSWRHATQLCRGSLRSRVPDLDVVANMPTAPITGVHLWFDAPITELPHGILTGRLSQWLFARPNHARDQGGHYYQVVISGSHDLAQRSRDDVVAEVQADLAACFPEASQARLIRSRVVTDPFAVFSYRPGLNRPAQQTAVAGLFLAGDWTDTGWPATMEGAVRSGYLAAERALAYFGRPSNLLVTDLPRSWLVRVLLGR